MCLYTSTNRTASVLWNSPSLCSGWIHIWDMRMSTTGLSRHKVCCMLMVWYLWMVKSLRKKILQMYSHLKQKLYPHFPTRLWSFRGHWGQNGGTKRRTGELRQQKTFILHTDNLISGHCRGGDNHLFIILKFVSCMVLSLEATDPSVWKKEEIFTGGKYL